MSVRSKSLTLSCSNLLFKFLKGIPVLRKGRLSVSVVAKIIREGPAFAFVRCEDVLSVGISHENALLGDVSLTIKKLHRFFCGIIISRHGGGALDQTPVVEVCGNDLMHLTPFCVVLGLSFNSPEPKQFHE